MTQKDNVKQLIGKSLNAYNNKVLQQIDRIEKKNKQQNHKISMLTNELDNDYLTKSEEGSVISLEHSKEGMVYIDSLEGNTLVNYCTDGSKELTLNGDIDLEGTFVTTTEGVDNGKVDVYCEGNTLVNLFNYNNLSHNINTHVNRVITLPHGGVCDCIFPTKTNVIYTVMLDIIDLPTDAKLRVGLTDSNQWYPSVDIDKSGFHKIKLENKGQAIDRLRIHQLGLVAGDGKVIRVKDIMILEGDWTNREIPPYFEGMKSVGQDDDNGHKIEILSQSSYPNLIKKSKNLSGNGIGSDTSNHNGVQYLIEDNVEFARVSANKQDFSNFYWWLQTVEPRKKGETYTISYDYRCTSDWRGYWYPSESYSGSFFPSTNGEWRRMKITRTVTGGDAKGDMLFGVEIIGTETGDYIDIKNVKMEKGTNNSKWIPSVMDEEFLLAEYSNKKEILLNEPLRGLPNGVCDKFVKQSGKWYVERNCGFSLIDGNYNWFGSARVQGSAWAMQTREEIPNLKQDGTAICDKYNVVKIYMDNAIDSVEISSVKNKVILTLRDTTSGLVESSTEVQIQEKMKEITSNNPFKIVYQLEIPTYEEIIDPTLITYLDTTHISNNSIIPCNMKVQNSGYNAIIKPSTLYTVALDTNKSGTIGMNLGGVKGTTTNNVAIITTPATLTDDSLRLYGKGIKGSKVRLLEGDKTNWIPSFFEGMKSSFEDKFDVTDNTYKMEILSNNKNYFNYKGELNQYYKGMAIGTEVNINTLQSDGGIFSNLFTASHHGRGQIIKVKPYTNYIIKSTVVNGGRININTPSMVNFVYGTALNGKLNKTFNTLNNNEICLSFHTVGNSSNPNAIFYDVELILESNDNLDYIPNKSNKIQFSSIKPLRKWDRFVFKDDKLMIERNTRVHIINDKTQYIDIATHGNKIKTIAFKVPVSKIGEDDVLLCKDFPNAYVWSEFEHCHTNQNIINITINRTRLSTQDVQGFTNWLKNNSLTIYSKALEPTYEEIPFELQKIILEGYENGTLFIDTNIPPTITTTYAGETPIVSAIKTNKSNVVSNTQDINDNIIPYLMDMDYRVVCLQLESNVEGISMAKLFGGVYEMLKRDILSKRLTKEEYGYRLTDYFNAGKLTEEQVRELEDLR